MRRMYRLGVLELGLILVQSRVSFCTLRNLCCFIYSIPQVSELANSRH